MIWIWDTDFISNDDNRYTKHVSRESGISRNKGITPHFPEKEAFK